MASFPVTVLAVLVPCRFRAFLQSFLYPRARLQSATAFPTVQSLSDLMGKKSQKRKFRYGADAIDAMSSGDEDEPDPAPKKKTPRSVLTDLSAGVGLPLLSTKPTKAEMQERCTKLKDLLTEESKVKELTDLMAEHDSFQMKPSGRLAHAPKAGEDNAPKEFRIRGHCLMETHNGNFTTATLEEDWLDFVKYAKAQNAWHTTVKAELSVNGKSKDGTPVSNKVHFHVIFEYDPREQGLDFSPKSESHTHRFRGAVPYFSPTKARGRRWDTQVHRLRCCYLC